MALPLAPCAETEADGRKSSLTVIFIGTSHFLQKSKRPIEGRLLFTCHFFAFGLGKL